MKKEVLITFMVLLFISCNSNSTYDTEENMRSKCVYLNGLDSLILNKTTINDIYRGYEIANIDTTDFYSSNINNRFRSFYPFISRYIPWKRLSIKEYDINSEIVKINMDFYNDTLVQIAYRYPLEDNDKKILPEYFVTKYGNGIRLSNEYLNSITNGSFTFRTNVFDCRFYQSKHTHTDMIIMNNGVYQLFVMLLHKPKLLDLFAAIDSAYLNEFLKNRTSSGGANNSPSGHNSMDADDKEYWNSVNKEKALKDAGMDNAARMERKARQEYLQGGGYKSPSGGSQIHYKGSQEQKEQLEEMKRRGW